MKLGHDHELLVMAKTDRLDDSYHLPLILIPGLSDLPLAPGIPLASDTFVDLIHHFELSRRMQRMLLARGRPAGLAGPGKRDFFRTVKLGWIGQASERRSVLTLCQSRLLGLGKHYLLSETECVMVLQSPSSTVGQLEKTQHVFRSPCCCCQIGN